MFFKRKKQSNTRTLSNLVEKTNDTGYVFVDINNDIGSAIESGVDDWPPLLFMAYAYARRAAVAALYIQGIVKKDIYEHVKSIFKGIQYQTDHTVDFQEKAFAESVKFMSGYNQALTSFIIKKIVHIAEEYEIPPGTLSDAELLEHTIDTAYFEQYSEGYSAESIGNDAEQQSVFNGGIRLEEAEVDILFIVSNGDVIYINDETEHLFSIDKDNDEKLDGRVVNFVFSGQYDHEVIEFFVSFDDADSYTMFTLQTGMKERLNYVAQAIFKYFSESNTQSVFSPIENYSTQYIYTFKLYRKNNKYFMVNNTQTQAYLIDEFGIKRDDVDEIKEIFWNDQDAEQLASESKQPRLNLDQRKEAAAQHVKNMCEGPMGQINLKFPADGKENQLVESSIGHLDDELILSTDPYLLAMAVLINTANSGLQHEEYPAVCMLSAAVLNAARGFEGTEEREIEGINGFAETALKLIEANRSKADLALGAELIINMAVNQWKAKGEKAKYEEYLKENGKLPDSKNNFDDIIEELYKLSEKEGELDFLMRISSTKDQWSNYEFEYRQEDEDWADELAHRLFCLRPDLIIQRFNNFRNNRK